MLWLKKKLFAPPPNDLSLKEELKHADCLLVKLGAKVGKDILDFAPDLKYIGMLGTGVGGIDLHYASKKNVTVCNIADYATEGVCEFTFGAILEYLRELERAKVQARTGNYSEATFTGSEIKGKNFGVIGLGHIGMRTALLASSFGAHVQYWSRNRSKEAEKKGITFQDLEYILQHSDILTINLALNSETNGFLHEQHIQRIKKGALVINPSPMELIHFDTLVSRLQQGDMSFILDHSDEMTEAQLHALKPFNNCVIYPPIAYTTKEATALKKDIFVSNLENFLHNTPTNKVN